jgi:hypothetical protein
MDRPFVEPYLSVVVTSRNDDHGGDPLKRLQAFVNSFDAQCRRTGLDAEVIIVEWNPPADRARLQTLVKWPVPSFCTYRFVCVPPELHATLEYSDVLPLFQMIAKNVGIRRARGRFVLVTNIDILFSNELVEYLASRRLEPGLLYRVDRHDIQADVPIDAPLDSLMEYCQTHQLRVHTRWGSYSTDASGHPVRQPDDIVDGVTVRLGRGWHVLEGDDETGRYRWGSEVAELIVDTEHPAFGSPAVLDIEIESNPYDALSWVEVVVTAGDRRLAQARVAGQARLAVPVDGFSGGERIELRVVDSPPESRRRLPAFERRDGLSYRVASARLRRQASADRDTHEYSSTGWTNEYHDAGMRVTATPAGLDAEAMPDRRQYYLIEYGPMRAPHAGLYRFNVSATVIAGAVSFGVLSGDRNGWIRATVNRREEPERRFEIAVDLKEDQRFWIAAFNEQPESEIVPRLIIHRMEGTSDPDLMGLPAKVDRPRPSVRRGWRWWAGRAADGVARGLGAAMGHRLRYRVARDAPEFKAVERALRASDEQLRATAPLQYLRDFNTFLQMRRPESLHVNGCGDFQLMAREHWHELRGYPEFQTFSMNIDGLFSYMVDGAGIKEQVLDLDIYHLEHEVGSGWSPEGEALLRRRIAERGITWLDARDVFIWSAYMHWLRRPMIFNLSDWGFGNAELGESIVAPGQIESRRQIS